MDSVSHAEDELGLSFDVQVLPELAFEDALFQDVTKVVFQRRGVIRDLVPQLRSYGPACMLIATSTPVEYCRCSQDYRQETM